MAEGVERFGPTLVNGGPGVDRQPDGPLVRYSDYALLRARQHTLRQSLAEAEAELDQARNQERQRLLNDPVQVALCNACGYVDDPRQGGCANCGGQMQRLSRSLVDLARQQAKQRIQKVLGARLKQYREAVANWGSGTTGAMSNSYKARAIEGAIGDLAALDTLDPSPSVLSDLIAELRVEARLAMSDGNFTLKDKVVWARERVEAALDPSGEQGEERCSKEEAVTRLRQLETLPENWDSHGGVPPTAQALDRLRGFDRALSYVPLSDGGLQVEFHALGLDFEIVIERDGSVGDYELAPASSKEVGGE